MDELPQGLPSLLVRAEEADDYWEGRVAVIRGSDMPLSFRGMYAIAYRRLSAIAHPSNLGLNFVTTHFEGGIRVGLEERREVMIGPFGIARALYAIGLYISAVRLGWPASADIDRCLTD